MKMHTNRHQEAKLLPPDTFRSRKNAQNCVCGRSSAPDLRPGLCPGPRWGSSQRSPKPHSWQWGGAPGKGEGKGWEGRGMFGREEKGKGYIYIYYYAEAANSGQNHTVKHNTAHSSQIKKGTYIHSN